MIHIVVPMAGRGSRFDGSSYIVPKPLIEVFPGTRMIEVVMSYLTPSCGHQYIFVCRDKHVRDFDLQALFLSKTQNPVTVTTDQVTDGPACTVLLAESWIDNDDELLIAYCDDFLNIDINDFLESSRRQNADGSLLVYRSENPSDSFAVLDSHNRVIETAEKKMISPYGTAGLYYFKKGKDFVRYAHRMIGRGKRSQNEFYVCPIYNELIEDGKTVVGHEIPVEANLQMGTPEELAVFIRLREERKVCPVGVEPTTF